jgi:hypothetical protein
MADSTADGYARLFGLGVPPPPSPWPISDVLLRRFNLRRDALGVLEATVWDEVDEKTQQWPKRRQQSLIDVVSAIADAEVCRQAWNPKVSRRRYRAVAKSALDALDLASALVDTFPPTNRQVHALAGELLDFVSAALQVNLTAFAFRTFLAAGQMGRFYANARRPPVPKRLIADLVTVALGRRLGRPGAISESDLRRRYLGRGSAQRLKRTDIRSTPVTTMWREQWQGVITTMGRARAAGVPRSPLTTDRLLGELRAFVGE